MARGRIGWSNDVEGSDEDAVLRDAVSPDDRHFDGTRDRDGQDALGARDANSHPRCDFDRASLLAIPNNGQDRVDKRGVVDRLSEIGVEAIFLSDCRGLLGKARRVVDSVALDQTDAGAVLVGEHAPAVDFLLIDPAVTMEGRADERRRHGNQRERDNDHRGEYRALVNPSGRPLCYMSIQGGEEDEAAEDRDEALNDFPNGAGVPRMRTRFCSGRSRNP